MKKILLLSTLFISSFVVAQKNVNAKKNHSKKNQMQTIKEFTPEQMATLKTKKMTLALDLTEDQQKKMYDYNLENTHAINTYKENNKKQKESNVKLTSDQKYEKMNATLDKKIEMKTKIKSILNEEQYQKWENAQKERTHKKKKYFSKKGNKK
jgi:periplasmic protein CpxP/Spy